MGRSIFMHRLLHSVPKSPLTHRLLHSVWSMAKMGHSMLCVTKVGLVTGRRQDYRFDTQRNSIDGLKVSNSLGKKRTSYDTRYIYITTKDRGEKKGKRLIRKGKWAKG